MLDIDIKPGNPPVTYHDRLLLIGSCFTGNIGHILEDLKFHVLYNPSGILFDPAAVARHLSDFRVCRPYSENDLFAADDIYHSWQHHSDFSSIHSAETLERINTAVSLAHEHLHQCRFLVITLGSAYSYRLVENDLPVANCHKAPAEIFYKHLMEIDEITALLGEELEQYHTLFPSLQVIFTVSPVRHIRDGVVANNRSKARLLESVHRLCEQYNFVHYFPAYEIVMDVLRDYRFFDIDQVHPNYAATEFVSEKFIETWMDMETRQQMEEVKKIITAYRHKPLHPGSAAYASFLDTYRQRTAAIREKMPFLDWSREWEYFSTKP